MRHFASILLLFAFLLVACESVQTPVQLEPSMEILDAGHNGGNEHFFWLPPMITPAPSFSGAFDVSADPVIEICAGAVHGCAQPILRIDLDSGLARNAVEEWYGADWFVFDENPEVGDVFRVSVISSGETLGYADVTIVDKATGRLKKTLGDEFLILSEANGKKFLRIRFRIEEGAVPQGWQRVELPDDAPNLQAIWGSGPDDVWMGGHIGVNGPAQTILRWNGSNLEDHPIPEGGVVSLWGFGPDDVWGVAGLNVLHFDGTSWKVVTTIPDANLKGIWGKSRSEMYAVGYPNPDPGIGNILRLDGSDPEDVTWEPELPPELDHFLLSVHGAGSLVYAVGDRKSADGSAGPGNPNGAVNTRKDGAWTMDIDLPFLYGDVVSVWATSEAVIYVLSHEGLGIRNGTEWDFVTFHNDTGNFNSDNPRSLWAASPEYMLLGGYTWVWNEEEARAYRQPRLFFYDGFEKEDQTPPELLPELNTEITAVWGTPDASEVFFVGASNIWNPAEGRGFVYRRSN